MNQEMEQTIKRIFFSNYKNPINKNESYEEFLLSYEKDDLERILRVNYIIEDDKEKFNNLGFIKTKEELKDEIISNNKKIYENIIKNINILLYDEIDYFINNYNGKVQTIELENLEYSPKFMEIIHYNLIAKVNYDEEKNILEIYSPKEVVKIIKELLNDNKIEKECEQNTEIIDNVHCLISTYGVIELSKLYEIYKEVFNDITQDKLLSRILINAFYDEGLKIINEFSDYLLYGIGFRNEKEAQEFLMKIPKKLGYKIYTKEQYNEIKEGSYHYEIEEFDTLFDYLSNELGMNEDEIYEFDNMFVLDYMFSYQMDSDTAKKNLSNNLEKIMPNLDTTKKAHISKMILSIAKNYPVFKFKGHTYNEVGDKYR